jgi:hypothetical protein
MSAERQVEKLEGDVIPTREPRPRRRRTFSTRESATVWLETWGEIEKVRLLTGDWATVPDREERVRRICSRLARPDANVLLIHHQVEKYLRGCGSWVYRLAAQLWVWGWEWQESEQTAGLFTVQYQDELGHHERRLLVDVKRSMAQEMRLRWRD